MGTAIRWVLGVLVALAAPAAAYATVLDLATSSNGTTPDTTEGFIGQAFFQWTDFQSTGTGVIDTFVQVQAQGNATTEQGYNTTVNGTFDTGSSPTFNHELLLSAVPIVNIGGVNYREFLLDINEPRDADDALLSLNEIQVFQSDTPNTGVETFTGGIVDIPNHTLVYRLDAGGDNTVELNFALNPGSGSGDMFMYVPDSLFTGAGQYVYLYSAFGNPNISTDGFEEWAVRLHPNVIPEPLSVSLMGLGLATMAARRIRRRF